MTARALALTALILAAGAAGPAPVDAQDTLRHNVHWTFVSEHDGDVLELRNGAIVAKTGAGRIGRLVGSPQALLFSARGDTWLWLYGEGVLRVGVLRAPDEPPTGQALQVTVTGVRDGGETLELAGGDQLEVDPLDAYIADIWVAPFDALLFEPGLLLRLERRARPITILNAP